jgi:hypothetical protein
MVHGDSKGNQWTECIIILCGNMSFRQGILPGKIADRILKGPQINKNLYGTFFAGLCLQLCLTATKYKGDEQVAVLRI